MAANKSAFKLLATAAAAALLCSQSATAAVATVAAPVDPLVALSALGTTGSSSAVCGVQTMNAQVKGCVLAMNDAAQPADNQMPPPEAGPPPPHGMNVLPLLLGLGALVAVAAILASGSSHGNGNLTPVSPA
jgi:hypothetical protein